MQYSFSRNETVAAIKSGKYLNIRGMFSPSATTPTTGKWQTAQQAIEDGNETTPSYSLFDMGALCWYFAQELVERGVKTPIGIADTAIGGQRIEEFMNNHSYAGAIACPDAIGAKEVRTPWNGQLFAKQVMPFVDMTVKGWTWYQGENNMDNIKGNAALNIGYSCKQRELVKGWRGIWSEVSGTTEPNAPFGIVTLASSGSEGGPNMGAMRLAQTAGYGVLPNPEIPHSFFAQAGDLEDAWGPAVGPCFSGLESQWGCCSSGDSKHPVYLYQANRSSESCIAGTNGKPEICDPACAAAAGTASQGGIHPRSKQPVGKRLATSGYKYVYGGSGAATGPTLSGCSLHEGSLKIEFNTTLLAGEKVQLNPYNSSLNNFVAPPPEVTTSIEACYQAVKSVCSNNLHNLTDCRNCALDPNDPRCVRARACVRARVCALISVCVCVCVCVSVSVYVSVSVSRRSSAWNNTLLKACAPRPINNLHEACHAFFPAVLPLRGSLMEVLISEGDTADASAAFCVEPLSNTTGDYCPSWASGTNTAYDSKAGSWLTVDITAATATSVTVNLAQLKGKKPSAVRYSWGIFDCCNTGDPLLWISKPCDTPCSITSDTLLPANPFIAEIVEGKCSCVAPQVC